MKSAKDFLHVNNLMLLSKGKWPVSKLFIWPLVRNKREIKIFKGFLEKIKFRWEKLLRKFPSLFNGPTVRLVDYYEIDGNLVLEVLPSDYRQGQVLGWLGVSMVPITSDGYLTLQSPTAEFSAVGGRGIRSLGCTPVDGNFVQQIIEEILEEINVIISEKQLIFIGLIEVRHPLSACTIKSLVVKIKLKESRDELLNLVKTAKSHEGRLIFLKVNKNIKRIVYNKKYSKTACLNSILAAESEIGNLGIKL